MSSYQRTDIERAAEAPKPLKPPTPLPKLQLFILLYLQLAEPITAFVILPFINQLVYEYGMTDGDEKLVGYYAGNVSSLFFLTEMVCVFHWGRISDRIGRRPVLLIGLWGLTLSICSFAVSKTFIALVLSRALSGALNGNIGVIKSMMAEITDETNQARAFSFLPMVFAGGSSAAGFIGGGFSHPYERFPKVFGTAEFWKNYPYALPCFISAAFSTSAFLLAFLFMKESLHSQCHDKNIGIPVARSNTDSGSSGNLVPTESTALLPKAPPPISLREVLTPQVRIAILNYGTFALLNVAYIYLQPLFMSTPISIGGLGLGAPTIGLILGLSGILNGLFQALFFSRLHKRYGTRKLFFVAILAYSLLYLTWPLMSFLAKRAGRIDAAVISVLVMQQLIGTLSGMGFSCSHIFITSSAPTRNALGATTGLAQSLVSLTRAVGPAATASLFALSLQHNLLGGQLIYLVLVVLVVLSLHAATRLPKVIKRVSDHSND